jgi:DNA polymerase-4
MHACVENSHEPEAANSAVSSASPNSSAANPREQQPTDQSSFAPDNSKPQDVEPANAEPQKTSAGLARWFGFAKSRARELPNIVHVGVDDLFASVEQVLNPGLRGKPVLVGRGCVASASYEAKSRGVKTAMSCREALRVCPKAIVVLGQYEQYADFAERVRRILESYTPAVETAALDDFYLNFAGTERLYPDYQATLRRMQNEILGRTGLNVSIGAGSSKVVASIASRLQRPRGFRMVPCGEEEAFLAPLPVETLRGIGHACGATLAGRGIATIGELRQVPKPALQAVFGEVIGQQIWERARGLDGREVLQPSTPKSISRETTIEGGTLDTEFLGGLTEYLSECIGSTLRESGKLAHTVGLRVCYVDGFSANQAVRLPRATNDQREILAAARDLFTKLLPRRVAVRLIGVNATHFEADKRQHGPFGANANRSWYLNRAVDSVRGHYKTKPNGLVLATLCLSR